MGLRRFSAAMLVASLFIPALAEAAPLTNPNDPRAWQGATIATFASLLGVTNQDIIDDGILDDGIFPGTASFASGFQLGSSPCLGGSLSFPTATLIGTGVTGCSGYSYNPGGYDYTCDTTNFATFSARGSCLDMWWMQDAGTGFANSDLVDGDIWDLGGPSNQVAVFPIIDHGPLPQEAMEYSVYLSNNPNANQSGPDGATQWVFAALEKVYLEGWHAGWVADGFTTVWRLPGGQTFRYVNVVSGGQGGLIADGDNEIDTVLGLTFGGSNVCPGSSDSDGDGVCDTVDNCISTPNPFQQDSDCDGIGDACDPDMSVGACNDGNDCTVDTCSGGICGHTTITCDDSNACTTDSCNPAGGCTYVAPSCDDGNSCTTDACNPTTGACFQTPIPGCVVAVCGNGIVEPGETCDDGNTANGDGCSDACKVETCFSIRRGSGTAEDTWIAAGDPGTNNGSSTTITTGGLTVGNVLLWFDVSAIPPTATITKGFLRVSQTYAGNAPMYAHLITEPWSENTVTWASFGSGYDPAPFTSSVFGPGPIPAIYFDMVPTLQAWINGVPNEGVLLEQGQIGQRILRSSESGTPQVRPVIQLCYTND